MARSRAVTDWPRLNEKLWERSGGACERCGKFLAPGAGERHHRRLRSGGGRDELANLLLLCSRCHTTNSPTSVHSNVAEAKKYGHIVTRYADPSPVPVLHAKHGWIVLDNAGGFTPSMFEVADEEAA
ncbi:HNH endonuclease [Streptomyces mirabilis]|uniref:HNH endonuclease n=1 Tax=Streptomyces mirabilis TaxID=68239 RepID=UPI0036A43DFA